MAVLHTKDLFPNFLLSNISEHADVESPQGVFLYYFDLSSTTCIFSVMSYWIFFARTRKKLTIPDVLCAYTTMALAICCWSNILYRLRSFLVTQARPSPQGLFYGILSVVVGQIAVLVYHFIASGMTPPTIQSASSTDKPKKGIISQLLGHASRPESFLILFAYLSITWMFCLMPGSYYSLNGGINWFQTALQIVVVDFFMYVVHVTEHRLSPLYGLAHKHHHRNTSPNLFAAFQGDIWDTVFMILLPLYATALLIHCNVWTYMAFGTIYPAYLMLVHSEYAHPWDPVFRRLGINTPHDHQVHHLAFAHNFGHFLTWWDRLFGTYIAFEDLQHKRAQPMPTTEGAKGLKQGAYGKVKIHSSKTLKHALMNPSEFAALVKFKVFGLPGVTEDCFKMPGLPSDFDMAEVEFCGHYLNKVSRSFAQVIRQLPPSLALPVCVFYLALRVLDTVEDDMDITKFDFKRVGVPILVTSKGDSEPATDSNGQALSPLATKITSLRKFWTLLYPNKTFTVYINLKGFAAGNVGEADEAALLAQYERVIGVFQVLPPIHQDIVADICEKMGNGMADYIERDLRQGTEDVNDYKTYCHIVAGQVGEGLSRQFAASGLESAETSEFLVKDSHVGLGSLCSDMGLFLQQTNIIRDYLEDYVDGRAFWPNEVWSAYVTTGGLGALAEPQNRHRAVKCLNELVTNALELFPRSIKYLRLIENGPCFRFCTIPQLMAIATLSSLYGNPKVFTGVVKIRKGIAARICYESTDWNGVLYWVKRCVKEIRAKVHKTSKCDPTPDSMLAKTLRALDRIEESL